VGARFLVNNGKSVIFWEDVWEGEVPLKLIFPKLYEYSGEQNCLVSECWDSGEWVMDFARPLSQNEARQWDSLLVLLQNIHIIDSNDSVKWVLEKSGRYTTKSMYRYLLHRGISNVHMIKMWKCRLPMKLKIFMWLVFHGRVQVGVVLGGMSWKGDTRCVVCSVLETIDHIFSPAQWQGWCGAGSRMLLVSIGNLEALAISLTTGSLWGCKKYNTKLFSLAVILWSLWTTRNKMVMEGVVLQRPAEIFYKTFSCTQSWRLRLK
jgi:hypothetical protein